MVMWRAITVVAVLILCGCAAQQEAFVRQREAERNAPNLDFQGPLRPATLSKAQIKMVQQGVARAAEGAGFRQVRRQLSGRSRP